MNVKPLLKHFPEIHHLPEQEQRTLLETAHQRGFGPDRKLAVWKSNLLSGALITAFSLLLITLIGPALHIPPALTATAMIVLVLPAFLIWQHKRFIAELRIRLRELLNN